MVMSAWDNIPNKPGVTGAREPARIKTRFFHQKKQKQKTKNDESYKPLVAHFKSAISYSNLCLDARKPGVDALAGSALLPSLGGR